MENNQEPKNLVLAQQTGIVISAVATLAIAGIKIFKTLKTTSIPEDPSE
jgi:hypothetical protein